MDAAIRGDEFGQRLLWNEQSFGGRFRGIAMPRMLASAGEASKKWASISGAKSNTFTAAPFGE